MSRVFYSGDYRTAYRHLVERARHRMLCCTPNNYGDLEHLLAAASAIAELSGSWSDPITGEERQALDDLVKRFQADTAKNPAPTMKPIQGYGDHMAIKEFVENVDCGGFTDDDGYGYYATATEMSDIVVKLHAIQEDSGKTGWTHVVWFNR